MSELVRYENEMNAVSFRRFNKRELNLFFTLCSKLRDKDDKTIELSFNEIKQLAEITVKDKAELVDLIDTMYDKFLLIQASFKGGSRGLNRKRMNFFTDYDISGEDEEVVRIGVTENFRYLVNVVIANGNYTTFLLEEYTKFKSTYSQECFRRLKQFRLTGFWRIKVSEFRKLMTVPSSYTMGEFDRKVLKPIAQELSLRYQNFEIKKIPSKRTGKRGRRPIEYLEFYFDKEKAHVYREFEGNEMTYDKPQIERTGEYRPPKKQASTGKSVATSNVPDWHDDDYKNTTSDEEKAQLEEYKKRRLASIQEEHQTDIYDFLEDKN